MPELPEVETVRRGLEKILPGRRIESVVLHRGGLRVPFTENMAERLQGQRFGEIGRRSKYLLLHLDGGDVLLSHLGMTGSWLARPVGGEVRKHDHAVFRLNDGSELVYHDPRRFGVMLAVREEELEKHPMLAGLGPEPFSRGFSPGYLAGSLVRRKGPVKPVLMDAGLVVGVGNIYACEALFRIGTHPATASAAVEPNALALRDAIRTVLKEAIASGGSTLRNYTGASGEIGGFQHFFYVYGREGEPCRICATTIERIVQAGRSSFFCSHCQPVPRIGKRKRTAGSQNA